MNISIEKLAELAVKYCNKKVPKGTLHGDSKSVIGVELSCFIRFVKKEISTEKPTTLYLVKTLSNYSTDRADQRVDGYLGFIAGKTKKICLYSRGEAIRKAKLFNAKAEKFKGTPNWKKHYFV